MKIIHQFFWLVFLASFGILLAQDIYVSGRADGYTIFQLETASAANGEALLKRWNATMVDTSNMLHYARLNTLVDFLFIIGYVCVLIIVSNYLMQREKNIAINEVLRFCCFAAILTGLLDVVEDFILLFDMYHYQPGNQFYSSAWVSYPKWFLAGFILVCWIVSLVHKLFNHKNNKLSTLRNG